MGGKVSKSLHKIDTPTGNISPQPPDSVPPQLGESVYSGKKLDHYDVILEFHYDIDVAQFFLAQPNNLLRDIVQTTEEDGQTFASFQQTLIIEANIKHKMSFSNFEETLSRHWCVWLRSLPEVEVSVEEKCLQSASCFRPNTSMQQTKTKQQTNSRDVWLEIRHFNPNAPKLNNLNKITLTSYTAGSLFTPSKFCQHWKVDASTCNHSLSVDCEREIIVIETDLLGTDCVNSMNGSSYMIKFPFDSLEKYIVIDATNDDVNLVLCIKHNPFFSLLLKQKHTEEIRVTCLKELGVDNITGISAFCLKFRKNKFDTSLLDIFRTNGLSIAFSHIAFFSKTNVVGQIERTLPGDFDTLYAWKCLTSLGPRITDAMSMKKDLIIQHMLYHRRSLCAELFYQMSVEAASDIFFDFMTVFQKCLREMSNDTVSVSRRNKEKYGRIVFTPTNAIFNQPDSVDLNRVLRKYTRNKFIRVSIRDEDLSKLMVMAEGSLDRILEKMRCLLQEGVMCGKTRFEFLGSSNSQLRDHGFWFCTASVDGVSAKTIRDALGDLSKEKCVAKYVARLGLCFSSTHATIDTTKDGCIVDYIEDIERDNVNGSGKYCFTDGIGMVSVPLADKIASAISLDVTPSAFQIRYGGCKGVLAKNPDLGNVNKIVIRKSMRKFDSPSTSVETMAHTRPGQLHLNRQIITLMSGLGVPDDVFLALQANVLSQLAKMFVYEEVALRMLDKYLRMESRETAKACMKFKEMYEKGVAFTNDAFFESLLITIYKSRINDLMSRSRIEVPADKGRILMGTVDETGLLKYGQVYIQYSNDIYKPQAQTTVQVGKVVIGKNPCFHPGDLRTFMAVNIPSLSHMVDCVVFPQNGHRPHPDEMSGSDLDGDMYHVCWDSKFLPPDCNKKAMDFPSAPAIKVDEKITVDHITQYIVDFIKCNMVGRIANSHVVHADKETEGIFSEKCLRLAKIHSDAVDFPKTGVIPEMGKDLKVEKYPHFMMKKDKPSYHSEKALGKLFDECENADKLTKLSSAKETLVEFDDDFRVQKGYEKYLSDAKKVKVTYDKRLKEIMEYYGIETEAEAVTGMIQKLKKGHGFVNVDKDDKIEVSNMIKQKILSLRKKVRAEFFKEFKGEDAWETKNKSEVFAKASSWYIVTFNIKRKTEFFSFPWVTIGDILTEIKKELLSDRNATGRPSLLKLGSSIIRNFDEYEKEWLAFNKKIVPQGTARMTDEAKYMVYIRRSLDEIPDIIPTFIFTWFWARSNRICRGGRNSVFTEIHFPLLVLQTMRELDMIEDTSDQPGLLNLSKEIQSIYSKFHVEYLTNAVQTANFTLKCFEKFEECLKDPGSNSYKFYDPVLGKKSKVKLSRDKSRKLSYLMKQALYEFIRLKSVLKSPSASKIMEKIMPSKEKLVLFRNALPFICENFAENLDLTIQVTDTLNSDLDIFGRSIDILQTRQRFHKLSKSRVLYSSDARDRSPIYVKGMIGVVFSDFPDCNHFKVKFEGNVIRFKPKSQKENSTRGVGNLLRNIKLCMNSIQNEHQYLFHGHTFLSFTRGKVEFKRLDRIQNTMGVGEIKKSLNETHQEIVTQDSTMQNSNSGDIKNRSNNKISCQIKTQPISDVENIAREMFGDSFVEDKNQWFEILLTSGHTIKLDDQGCILGMLCPTVKWATYYILKEDGADIRMDIDSKRESSPTSFQYDPNLLWLTTDDCISNIISLLNSDTVIIHSQFKGKIMSVIFRVEHRYFMDGENHEIVVEETNEYTKFNDEIFNNPKTMNTWFCRYNLNAEYEDIETNHDLVDQIAKSIEYLQRDRL